MKIPNYFLLVFAGLLLLILAACSPQAAEMPKASLPAGLAFAEGKEIYFIHTETSDADLAKLLTDMMASPVILVPALGNVPSAALANVYVFDNGVKGRGPLGFQPDVFDSPPGSAGYSPLRKLNVVTWSNPVRARLLKSVAEIFAAQAEGEVKISQPGPVVNMPFVVWDGGKR